MTYVRRWFRPRSRHYRKDGRAPLFASELLLSRRWIFQYSSRVPKGFVLLALLFWTAKLGPNLIIAFGGPTLLADRFAPVVVIICETREKTNVNACVLEIIITRAVYNVIIILITRNWPLSFASDVLYDDYEQSRDIFLVQRYSIIVTTKRNRLTNSRDISEEHVRRLIYTTVKRPSGSTIFLKC